MASITAFGLVFGCHAATNSKLYRAFLEHEKNDPYGSTVYSYSHLVGGVEAMRSLRFKNFSKDAKHIDLDTAVSAVVSKTSDSGAYVVMITDVDGNTTSLWLDGGKENSALHVTGTTPY